MAEEQRELPRYQSNSQVWALKIAGIVKRGSAYQLSFDDSRYAPIEFDAFWHTKNSPYPGGYYVVHENNGPTFIPADVFEKGYKLVNQ